MLLMVRKVIFSLLPLKGIISIMFYVKLPWLLALGNLRLRWEETQSKSSRLPVLSINKTMPSRRKWLKVILPVMWRV